MLKTDKKKDVAEEERNRSERRHAWGILILYELFLFMQGCCNGILLPTLNTYFWIYSIKLKTRCPIQD